MRNKSNKLNKSRFNKKHNKASLKNKNKNKTQKQFKKLNCSNH